MSARTRAAPGPSARRRACRSPSPEELVEQLERLRSEAIAALRTAAAYLAFDDARSTGRFPRFLSERYKHIGEAEAA
ncbi:hypothetical protein SAMN05216371_7282 [Streptomyces sp. TLI_053]|nr:hypothetical protein SAMN05216371_7282 [Streptomyces sp. TLI_053]